MRNAVLVGFVMVAVGAAFACSSSSSDPAEDDTADGGDTTGSTPTPVPSNSGGGGGSEGQAGTGAATGLPCDVQAVVENRCLACHSGTNPKPLLNYDDFMQKGTSDPTKTLAQLSVERIQSTTSPMPPPPAAAPEADEIQSFVDWQKAGFPRNNVACTDAPPDGGTTPADGGTEAGADGGTTTKCTSGKTWTGGNTRSPLMRPGEACNACHQVMGGPNLRVAGTVYPTLHEPNDCNGSAPPPQLTVIVTDKNNRTVSMPVNSAGNFFTQSKINAPFKAKVTDGTKTRAMVGSVTSGDCNSCHTVLGVNGAPGRIEAP